MVKGLGGAVRPLRIYPSDSAPSDSPLRLPCLPSGFYPYDSAPTDSQPPTPPPLTRPPFILPLRLRPLRTGRVGGWGSSVVMLLYLTAPPSHPSNAIK